MEDKDYMRDAAGNLIAKENIKEIDLARDGLVKDILPPINGEAILR